VGDNFKIAAMMLLTPRFAFLGPFFSLVLISAYITLPFVFFLSYHIDFVIINILTNDRS